VSGLCRAGRALSLRRECSTGIALTHALLLRQRELCPIPLRGVAPGVTRSDWRSRSPPESK
jgi:hypothetical protein